MPDIEDAVDRLVRAGVVVNRYDGPDLDVRGIGSASSSARIAWFHNPDGNNHSLRQRGRD